MLESITFALAALAYAGLAATAAAVAHGRMPIRFFRVVAAIVILHVALVWHIRYTWSVVQATSNGYLGFSVFHAALGAIVIAAVTGGRTARVLILASFGLVTFGAVGAVFRDDVAATYRVPVILSAVLGALGIAMVFRPLQQRTLR